MTKYVDDINIATSLIPKGFSWTKEDRKWKLKWSEEQEKLDEGKSPELVTMEKIRWIGDQLVPGLKLTQDLPENHPSGKCPMLDFQVWAQETGSHVVIRHTFYQKATTSPLVFNAGGAYGWKPKITTLSEELGRRLVNMDLLHTDEERKEIVVDFIQKLNDSGYRHIHRQEILRSGCRKYYRRLIQHVTGGRKLYRAEEEMKASRIVKKLQNQTWFKSQRGGKELTPRKDLPSRVQEENLKSRTSAPYWAKVAP